MILCCGEALIDMIPEATVTGREGFVPHPGGAVFNTAIALGRLGAATGMLTGVSTDMFGARLFDAMTGSGVDTAHVVRSDRPTTLAFVQLQNGQAQYSFFDENSAGRLLDADDMPVVAEPVRALFFGGISLACEPGADAYARVLDRAGAGRVVMLDPNIRSGFIADEPRYRARLDRMIGQSDIVKVSDEDLEWLHPNAATAEAAVQEMLARGPALVIVTRGSAGATGYLRRGGTVTVPAGKAQVVDTVGAGDTFNAGVLAEFARRDLLDKQAIARLTPEEVEAALTFGARVAAVTVSRAGANPPWTTEL